MMSRIVHAFALLPSLLAPVAAIGNDGSDLGARIALRGTSNGAAPCMACHGIDGAGMAAASYPRIAGLDAGYIKAQLRAWKAGTRANDPLGLMKAVADRLTEDEVVAVAAYYAAQPGAAPVAGNNVPTATEDGAVSAIKHNMPLVLTESLSDQDAWDLAAFINSHERPQDPRYQGDLDATAKEFRGGKFDYYGQREGPDGSLWGERPASK